MSELVFVYGTLRPCGAAEERMKEAEWIGQATVSGSLYKIDWYPGLVLGDGPKEVKGDLFSVPEMMMAGLDAYEGCAPTDSKPHEYHRTWATVKCSDGAVCGAWVWEYSQSLDQVIEISGGDWLEYELGDRLS